jgi:hypothetical protein
MPVFIAYGRYGFIYLIVGVIIFFNLPCLLIITCFMHLCVGLMGLCVVSIHDNTLEYYYHDLHLKAVKILGEGQNLFMVAVYAIDTGKAVSDKIKVANPGDTIRIRH